MADAPAAINPWDGVWRSVGWLSDGAWIAAVGERDSAPQDLWLLPVPGVAPDGSRPRQVTDSMPTVLRAALVARSPPAPLAVPAVGLDGQRGRRREAPHTAEDGPRRGYDGVKAHVALERHGIEAGVDPAAGQQRRERRGEAQRTLDLGEVERLDPEPVAHEVDPAGVPVGQGEGEHALEALDASGPPHRPRAQGPFGAR